MSSSLNPHLSDRLTRIIENKAEEITAGTVKKLQTSLLTESYHKLAYRELYSRDYEVYRDFGRWLWDESSRAVQAWYTELGERRCEEGVPLAESLWALVLTKDYLLQYLDAWGLADSALELYQQQEFDRVIGRFFDRALCYTAEGYDRHASERERRRETIAS